MCVCGTASLLLITHSLSPSPLTLSLISLSHTHTHTLSPLFLFPLSLPPSFPLNILHVHVRVYVHLLPFLSPFSLFPSVLVFPVAIVSCRTMMKWRKWGMEGIIAMSLAREECQVLVTIYYKSWKKKDLLKRMGFWSTFKMEEVGFSFPLFLTPFLLLISPSSPSLSSHLFCSLT